MPSGLREVNLEAGLPVVDDALKRLVVELKQSVLFGCTVLKVIHGYGSTGTGGRIRVAVRAYLAKLKTRGDIRDFIIGEDFSLFSAPTRAAFLVCGDLRSDPDRDRHNNGVTFIIL